MKKSFYIITIFALLLQPGLTFPPAASAQYGGGELLAPTYPIHYVKPVATGVGDCSSWANACGLQTALGAAISGDEIWAQAGTYKPTSGADRTATFALQSGVAIYGGFAGTETSREQRNWVTNVTTLSGDIGVAGDNSDNSYHVVASYGSPSEKAILDGFTITGGYADGNGGASYGGGLYNNGNMPTLTNLTFSGNYALNYGGGMYRYNNPLFKNSAPTLTNVTFSNNTATFGGGMYNQHSNTTLMDVTFYDNHNTSSFLEGGGGGMYNTGSDPTLTDVIFSGNRTPCVHCSGGGMYNTGSNPTLTDVIFSGNYASDFGGGMYNTGSSPLLTNVSFSGNMGYHGGGGMYNLNSSPSLTNATFSANSSAYIAGGMRNGDSSPTLTNAIFWGNMAPTGAQIDNASNSTPLVAYSDIQGSGGSGGTWNPSLGTDGGGNIDADPWFVRSPSPGGDGTWCTSDDDYGDLRLQHASPAIDAGDNAAVPSGVLTDLLGFPRFIDIASVPNTGSGTPPIVDMGAYEAQMVVYLPVLQK